MFEIIAQDKNLIPYRKELNAITGGALESIFFQQLLYWHEKNGGEFYKFKEPCNHEFYKAGDSWVEELGISAKIIDRIIRDFKEKGFLEIKHTMDRRTFYVLNIDEIEKALKGIYLNPQREDTKTPKGKLRKPPKVSYENSQKSFSIKNNNIINKNIYINSETTTETTTEITQKEKEKIQKENPQIQKNQTELLDKKSLSEKYPNLNLEAFEMWCEYKGKRYTKQGKVIALNKLVKFSQEIQKEMVERSIMNNWQGLFEPKEYQAPTKQEKAEVPSSCYSGGTNYGEWWDKKLAEARAELEAKEKERKSQIAKGA